MTEAELIDPALSLIASYKKRAMSGPQPNCPRSSGEVGKTLRTLYGGAAA